MRSTMISPHLALILPLHLMRFILGLSRLHMRTKDPSRSPPRRLPACLAMP